MAHEDEPPRQRLGRPAKPPGETRSELVRVYLTPGERDIIETYARAHGLRVAEYLRRVGVGADPRLGAGREPPGRGLAERAEVRFALPRAEKELLESAARREGLFLGPYLRRLVWREGGPTLSDSEAMRLIYELSAVGNNLNQAVRDVHAGRQKVHDWETLRRRLTEVLEEIARRYVR